MWSHPEIILKSDRQSDKLLSEKMNTTKLKKKLETEIEMLNYAKKTEASPQAGPVNYDCSNLYHCDNENIK